MCVNIGHGDERVIRAVQQQVETLAYANPFMATEPRARLGAKLAEIAPGDIDTFFFTNGGAEANENAIKLARLFTGRHKIIARYRSYHGGDGRRRHAHRRPAALGRPSRDCRASSTCWTPITASRAAGSRSEQWLAMLEETIQLEGPQTIAAIIVEPVTGTNGILVPPDGLLEGIRAICDRHGILMIADEVMSGFGRTGRWFAVDHWGVVPDLLSMAKGLTSAYVPLGAVGMRRHIAEHFTRSRVLGRADLQQPPAGLRDGAGDASPSTKRTA